MERIDRNIQFRIFSRQLAEIESVVNANAMMSHVWISIHNTTDPDLPIPHQNEMCREVLTLGFDDTDVAGWIVMGQEMQLMTEDQADQILQFIEKHLGHIGMICVHCEAGISRSAATAAALSLLINGHDSNIQNSGWYCPNAHVKSLILQRGSDLRTRSIELGFCSDDI